MSKHLKNTMATICLALFIPSVAFSECRDWEKKATVCKLGKYHYTYKCRTGTKSLTGYVVTKNKKISMEWVDGEKRKITRRDVLQYRNGKPEKTIEAVMENRLPAWVSRGLDRLNKDCPWSSEFNPFDNFLF